MFWTFLIVVVAGTFLITLGAMSVFIKFLLIGFKVALAVIAAQSGFLTWRWYRGRNVRHL